MRLDEQEERRAPEEPPRARRLAWSTAIFAAATGLSRVLGLFREIVARRYFGVEGPINAFTVAFQVPNLIRALAADMALSAAFVPVFSELLEKGQRERAWRVASSLFWVFLLGLGAITALFMVLAPWVMRAFGLGGELEDLASGLSRVLFPLVLLMGVSGIVVGILNSYEEFSVPAITPVLWNLAIIVALVVFVPRFHSPEAKLYVYAGGVLAGTVIQVLTPVPWLRRRDGRIRAVIDLHDPAVKRVFALMLPVTLGIGLINFNLVINTFFAARFIDPELAPSAIDAAFRIYMLPQGMFSVAVATVLSRVSPASPPEPKPKDSVTQSPSDSGRSASCSSRQARSRPCSPSRLSGSSISGASSSRARPPSSRPRWPPSRSASPSTGRC